MFEIDTELLMSHLEVINEYYRDRAILLTERSHSNIVSKIAHLVFDHKDKKMESDIKKEIEKTEKRKEEFEKSPYMTEIGKVEEMEKRLEKLNETLYLIQSVEYTEKRHKNVSKKPLKLIPKMYMNANNLFSTFDSANSKTSEFVDTKVDTDTKEANIVPSNIKEGKSVIVNVDNQEELAKIFEKDVVENNNNIEKKADNIEDSENTLPDDFENIIAKSLENKYKEITKEDTKVVDITAKKKAEKDTSKAKDEIKLDSDDEISKLKNNYMEVVKKVKEQNKLLQAAEKAKKEAEKARKDAEKARKDAMNKLIKQTEQQQKLLEEVLEKESQINQSISEEKENTEMINKETAELLYMLEDDKDSKTLKAA